MRKVAVAGLEAGTVGHLFSTHLPLGLENRAAFPALWASCSGVEPRLSPAEGSPPG